MNSHLVFVPRRRLTALIRNCRSPLASFTVVSTSTSWFLCILDVACEPQLSTLSSLICTSICFSRRASLSFVNTVSFAHQLCRVLFRVCCRFSTSSVVPPALPQSEQQLWILPERSSPPLPVCVWWGYRRPNAGSALWSCVPSAF